MTSPPPAPELEWRCCPLCNSDQSSLHITAIDRQCGIPGEYHVHRCLDCRHLFMNPRPTAETLHLCYPPGYGPHQTPVPDIAAKQQSSDSEKPIDVPAPWYLRYLPLRYIPGLKSLYYWLMEDLGQPLPVTPEAREGTAEEKPEALELGCSTGAYLARLIAAGWNVTGIEPDSVASQKCRDAGLNVQTGILDDVEMSEESFECVCGWMVVEHIIDPVGTLAEFHRLLKPGGQLLFSVPNVGCWEPTVFQKFWYLWEAPRHLSHFTPRSLRKVLRERGFTEVQVLHQRNVLNVIGSLGILLKNWRLTAGIGERILRYPDTPRLAIQLLLAPAAHVLSFFRQGGRLTVLARKPLADSSAPSTEGSEL